MTRLICKYGFACIEECNAHLCVICPKVTDFVDVDSLKEKIAKLLGKNQELKSRLDEALEENFDLEDDVSRLECEKDDLEFELENLHDLESEVANLKNENKSLKRKVENVERFLHLK